MRAAAKAVFGTDSLEGRTIAVQGAGNVASHLIEHLSSDGATVRVSDIYEDKLKALVELRGVSAIAPDDIYDLECDIFSPAALGGSINDKTIDRLRTKIVAGAANNQLEDPLRHATLLAERDILYVPDYVINAGGLINVACELEGYSRERAMLRTESIYSIVERILESSARDKVLTVVASNDLAEQRIEAIANVKRRYVGASQMKEF
jgi:leucine dehydrogenase